MADPPAIPFAPPDPHPADHTRGLLSAKQEAFCRAFVACGVASAAYRATFAADGMKHRTVISAASKLTRMPKVRARISALLAAEGRSWPNRHDINRHRALPPPTQAPAPPMRWMLPEAVDASTERHARELARLRDVAMQHAAYRVALLAELARAKALGVYDKAAQLPPSLDAAQKFAEIETLTDAELTARIQHLARQIGITIEGPGLPKA